MFQVFKAHSTFDNQHNPTHQQAREKKNHMIISIDVDKTFHNPIYILNKNSQQTWNNRNFYNLIKIVLKKKKSPIANNILNVDYFFNGSGTPSPNLGTGIDVQFCYPIQHNTGSFI